MTRYFIRNVRRVTLKPEENQEKMVSETKINEKEDKSFKEIKESINKEKTKNIIGD